MENKMLTWKVFLCFAIGISLSTSTFAQQLLHKIEVEGRAGYIFPTHSFFGGDNRYFQKMKYNSSGHLKYSFQLNPNTVAGQAYAGAYQGIGVGYFNFGNKEELGNPIALYLFQGGRIAQLAPRLSLNYEWNFGASFGWKPYDAHENPNNKIIGSKANAYLNANIYLNWALASKLDLMVGVTGSHFSNGNTRYPNSGLNTVDAKIGLAYYFNRTADQFAKSWQRPIVPPFPRHVSYDLTLFGSWRKKAVDVANGQVPAPSTYTVMGFSFAPMYNISYKFRAGVALDGVYDHSANIKEDYTAPNGFRIPSSSKQMSLGLSARGEFVMPYFSIGFGLGANILHNGGDLRTFYQILALKVDVSRNTYLHVGYNLKDFHDPNYLMLGIGFRFNNKRPRLF